MGKEQKKKLVKVLIAVFILIGGYGLSEDIGNFINGNQLNLEDTSEATAEIVNVEDVPEYSGAPYVELNGNSPYFTDEDIERLSIPSYEYYSVLDNFGRAGFVEACVGEETMPDEGEERGSIGMIKPPGWHTVKYDCVDGKYLYNRCHLIGWQLTSENANSMNLITGTRSMNVDGMLPFEDVVAEYVHSTGNHVMYRVTPIYKEADLVASGVMIEAKSVEDNGEGLCFNVYCYNVQDGIEIDYATGESKQL